MMVLKDMVKHLIVIADIVSSMAVSFVKTKAKALGT